MESYLVRRGSLTEQADRRTINERVTLIDERKVLLVGFEVRFDKPDAEIEIRLGQHAHYHGTPDQLLENRYDLCDQGIVLREHDAASEIYIVEYRGWIGCPLYCDLLQVTVRPPAIGTPVVVYRAYDMLVRGSPTEKGY